MASPEAAVLDRFPAIRSLEVGNEFNGNDFVSGPIIEMSLGRRAAAYVALLRSVYTQAKAENPDVRVIGGAALAIPDGYLAQVFAAGGGQYMDALALHPYTTPAEQLARQIAVLRRIPGARHIPVEITEFGAPSGTNAPARLLKGYCQLALAGVTRLVWYPLGPRGDGFLPLLDAARNPTPVGRMFGLIARKMVGRRVQDIAPDAFTYGCRFGQKALILWGAPRRVDVKTGVRVVTPDGMPADVSHFALSRRVPLVFLSDHPISLGRDVILGPARVLVDSFDQFAYPAPDGGAGGEAALSRLSFQNGQETRLRLSPGQGGEGTLWTPSLGDAKDGFLRLSARMLRPAGNAQNPVLVINRYRAPRDMRVTIRARFTPEDTSVDGITVDITLNGKALGRFRGKAPVLFVRKGVSLHKGDRLDFRVGPNGDATGDVTAYRITLLAGGS